MLIGLCVTWSVVLPGLFALIGICVTCACYLVSVLIRFFFFITTKATGEGEQKKCKTKEKPATRRSKILRILILTLLDFDNLEFLIHIDPIRFFFFLSFLFFSFYTREGGQGLSSREK